MPQNMFNRGMDFIRPQMMQSALGTGIPGAPSNFRKLGTIFGNVLQGNLGITKSDETGSFTFDPYQEGFKLESPGGFGIGVYGNKMSAPGEGFNVVPMGKTIEANFRFGSDPRSGSAVQNLSNNFSNDYFNQETINPLTGDKVITDEKGHSKRVPYIFREEMIPAPYKGPLKTQEVPQREESAGRKFLNQFITDDKIDAAQNYRTYY